MVVVLSDLVDDKISVIDKLLVFLPGGEQT
jgi:hypothetical protein